MSSEKPPMLKPVDLVWPEEAGTIIEARRIWGDRGITHVDLNTGEGWVEIEPESEQSVSDRPHGVPDARPPSGTKR